MSSFTAGPSSTSCASSTERSEPKFKDTNILTKMLIPSYCAGSIIGKQGQTIIQLQQKTGVSIKISKSRDFYPGTTERIVLIHGKLNQYLLTEENEMRELENLVENVGEIIRFMVEKVVEMSGLFANTQNTKNHSNSTFSNRNSSNRNDRRNYQSPEAILERSKQVKIIVPNSTAGLIIGKKGLSIKEIMDLSSTKIQLTQKPETRSGPDFDTSENHQKSSIHSPLSERVVTVFGESKEQLYTACEMILGKILEDPMSSSCPNLSYQNYSGLVANANPIGSPYAPLTQTTSNTTQANQYFDANDRRLQNFQSQQTQPTQQRVNQVQQTTIAQQKHQEFLKQQIIHAASVQNLNLLTISTPTFQILPNIPGHVLPLSNTYFSDGVASQRIGNYGFSYF